MFCVFAWICVSALIVKLTKNKVWWQHSYRRRQEKNPHFHFLTVDHPLGNSPSLRPGQFGLYTHTLPASLLYFHTSNVSFLRLREHYFGRLHELLGDHTPCWRMLCSSAAATRNTTIKIDANAPTSFPKIMFHIFILPQVLGTRTSYSP